jgi:hypothetical protein
MHIPFVHPDKTGKFFMDFGVGWQMRTEREGLFRAEGFGSLALGITVFLDTLLIHDAGGFAGDAEAYFVFTLHGGNTPYGSLRRSC